VHGHQSLRGWFQLLHEVADVNHAGCQQRNSSVGVEIILYSISYCLSLSARGKHKC
jgi:hypothetical protein